jgi:HK97 family phage major capsid protein
MNEDLKTNEDLEIKADVKTKDDPLAQYKNSENKFNPELKDFRMFLKAIVYNRPELFPQRIKSGNLVLNESNATEGGYLVPQEWVNKIYDNVGKYGVARRNATILKMNRRQLLVPKLTTLPSFSFVNEMSMKPMSVPAFDQVALTRHDGGFITCFSRQLIEDEDFDLLNFVTDLTAKIILKNEDDAAFRGLAPINGLLNPESGLTAVLTSGQQFDTIDYDNIIDATVAVPSHNLVNAKWFMSRSVWGFIKKLRYQIGESTYDEYIVSPEDRQNMTLEGFPVVLTEGCYAMSETGRDKPFIVFGDLRNLLIGERKGLTVDFSREATVDDGQNKISLWQNGLIGLNFGVSFDMQITYPDSMCTIRTIG